MWSFLQRLVGYQRHTDINTALGTLLLHFVSESLKVDKTDMLAHWSTYDGAYSEHHLCVIASAQVLPMIAIEMIKISDEKRPETDETASGLRQS